MVASSRTRHVHANIFLSRRPTSKPQAWSRSRHCHRKASRGRITPHASRCGSRATWLWFSQEDIANLDETSASARRPANRCAPATAPKTLASFERIPEANFFYMNLPYGEVRRVLLDLNVKMELKELWRVSGGGRRLRPLGAAFGIWDFHGKKSRRSSAHSTRTTTSAGSSISSAPPEPTTRSTASRKRTSPSTPIFESIL